MKKKVNFRILKEITLNELDSVIDKIFLVDLVERVANKYSKTSPPQLKSRNFRKIKKCDMVICNIAKNNGWGSKNKKERIIFIGSKKRKKY